MRATGRIRKRLITRKGWSAIFWDASKYGYDPGNRMAACACRAAATTTTAPSGELWAQGGAEVK